MGKHVVDKNRPSYKYFEQSLIRSLIKKETSDFKITDLDTIIKGSNYNLLTYRELDLAKQYLTILYQITLEAKEECAVSIETKLPSETVPDTLRAYKYHNTGTFTVDKVRIGEGVYQEEVETHLYDKGVYLTFYEWYLKARLTEVIREKDGIRGSGKLGTYTELYELLYSEFGRYTSIFDRVYDLEAMVWLIGEKETTELVLGYLRNFKKEIDLGRFDSWVEEEDYVRELDKSKQELYGRDYLKRIDAEIEIEAHYLGDVVHDTKRKIIIKN